jgi:hypothetical protein
VNGVDAGVVCGIVGGLVIAFALVSYAVYRSRRRAQGPAVDLNDPYAQMPEALPCEHAASTTSMKEILVENEHTGLAADAC